MMPLPPPPQPRRLPLWDIALAVALVAAAFVVAQNVVSNMEAAGLNPGFSFLFKEAGFDVSESLIPYHPGASYVRVILTGLINTLFLAAVSLFLANLVGLAVGLVSVGPSALGRMLAAAYVELFRNLPKILVLLVLFVTAVNGLPPVRQAIALGPVQISNRSLYLPSIVPDPKQLWLLGAFLIGCALAYGWHRRAVAWQVRAGRQRPVLAVVALCLLAPPTLAVFVVDVPLPPSVPVLQGFDFQGGVRLSLQFLVVAVTLGLYHGAQIAEVIRGGIEAVPKGQTEAAAALGLERPHTMRLVVLPQVMRIVLPPLGNQYVNLTKNTSIAIAVGYSDLMSVTGTIINQTFRPMEMMLITMTLYLGLCLGLTAFLNRLNDRLRTPGARQ